MWKNNNPRTDLAGLAGAAAIQALALIIEAAILILLIYFINRFIIDGANGTSSGKSVPARTAKISAILSLCFIAILIWASLRR